MQLISQDSQPGGVRAIFRVSPEEAADFLLWKKALMEVRKSFAVNSVAMQSDYTPVDKTTNRQIATNEEEQAAKAAGTLEYEAQFIFTLLGV